MVAMVGLVVDSQYNAYHNGNGLNEALSILNVADGLTREELGIALKVASVVVIDDPANDPMNLGEVTMKDMMHNFKDYRHSSDELGSEIGLATLFSGNKNIDAPLGLAFIGAACRTDGFDVNVVTPYKLATLLATHEIGHSLGAYHDDETSCQNDPGHIMWPFLSSVSGRTFSSCSSQAISKTIMDNNCHIEALDLSLSLSNINAKSLAVFIKNEDLSRAAPGAVLTIDGPGVGGSAATHDGCKLIGEDTLQCNMGALLPMEIAEIIFTFPDILSDTATITATVGGSGFLDMATENNGFKTDIYGNSAGYNGPVSDPATLTANAALPKASVSGASSNNGGSVALVNIFTVFILLLVRRRYSVGVG